MSGWIRRVVMDRGPGALGHVALSLLVTTPMITTLNQRMVGNGDVDVWNHAWGLWWFWASITAHHIPLDTMLLNAPSGGTLWFIDPIGGVIGMGLVPLVGLTAAWNLTILSLVAFASWAGRQLAKALGAGERASWIGAVGVAASPHVISEIHNGISEAVGVAWSVFALSALIRAIAAPERARGWMVTGLLGGLTVLGTYYYALSLALAAAGLLSFAFVTGPRRPILRGVALGVLPAMLIAIPVVLTVHHTVADAATAIIPRMEGAWKDRFWALQHNAVDPLSFFVPGNFQSVDLAALGEAFRHTSYLGWFVLIPALRAPRRRWLWAAAVPLTFSLGPFLWIAGDWVRVSGHLIALPYRLLLEVLPSGAIAHPQRLGFVGIALVVGLGASGVRERFGLWVAGGLLAELLLLSPAPWPVARAPALDIRYAEAILSEVDPRVFDGITPIVMDLPAEAPGQGMATSRYLVFQTVHHQPIPYGPNVRQDGFRLFRNQMASSLVYERKEAFYSVSAPDLHHGDAGWIALHTDLGDTTEVETWLRSRLGEPETYGPVLLWDVRPAMGAPGTPGGPPTPPNDAQPAHPAPPGATIP